MEKTLKKLVVFDLDGTIIDTIGDIAAAVNRALVAYGLPVRTVDQVTSYLGNGSLMLIRRATGGVCDDEKCMEIRQRFRDEYEKDMYSHSSAYDGIAELMEELSSRGVKIAVITNKDHRCAVPMIKHFFGDRVDVCRGVIGDTDRKPNPEKTLSLLKELGISVEESIFIGDGMADKQVSENCGMDFIPVGYGYTDAEKLVTENSVAPVPDVASLRRELLKIC